MRLELDLAARRGTFTLAAKAQMELQDITALFGPSGSGKTTILRAVAGFEPGLGRVAYGGQAWQGEGMRVLPAHKRPAGYVFQQSQLLPHLSVARNLAFAERRAWPSGPSISRGEVIDTLDIEKLLPRAPDALSGGELQRVAIARALLSRPALLLMDEPLSALDRGLKRHILPMIRSLPARFGLPILYVSHQLAEISQLADQVAAISNGQILWVKPAVEALAQVAPELSGHFEAGSLIEGRISTHDPEFALTRVDIGGTELSMPALEQPKGSPVRLRVRARDIALARERPEGLSVQNILCGKIIAIHKEEGAFAEVSFSSGQHILTARLTRKAVADMGLGGGMQIYALIKAIAFDRRFG